MANNEDETACATQKWMLLHPDTGGTRAADATVMSDKRRFLEHRLAQWRILAGAPLRRRRSAGWP